MPANRVYDMDFDEVSTVDVPANQHGLIVLTKRANPEETTVADRYFDPESGDEITDMSTLEQGALVMDEDGVLLAADWGDEGDEGDGEFDGADERELEAVGKSVFLQSLSAGEQSTVASLSKALREAASEEAAQQVLATELAKRDTEIAQLSKRAQDALEIAKAARERELDREYTEVAKAYNVPVDPEVLGPVLKRLAQTMSKSDCQVIDSVLRGSGDIFKQFGVDADMDAGTDDLADEAQRYLAEHGEHIGKSAGGERRTLSKEATTVAYLDANPEAYAQRRREQRGY